MPGIRFTQFLLPDGRQRPMWIERSPEVTDTADRLVAAGCKLEIEMLNTGDISMTVEHARWDPPCSEVCANGPSLPEHIDKLIRDADRRLRAERKAT